MRQKYEPKKSPESPEFTKKEGKRGKIKNAFLGFVELDVECPHCTAIQKWNVPMDAPINDYCEECGVLFKIDSDDLRVGKK